MSDERGSHADMNARSVAPDGGVAPSHLLVDPPARPPLALRPALWLAAKLAKKNTIPAQILSRYSKGAIGAAVLELCAPSASDLDARSLAIARITASAVAGCPFCIDMNAATWARAGLHRHELDALLSLDEPALRSMGAREHTAARFAIALSKTPIHVEDSLRDALRTHFDDRERVVLADAIALVNFWARFNQAMGVSSAGFFDDSQCTTGEPR